MLNHHIQYDSRKSDNYKGYTAILSENNDPNGRGDLHEGFDIGYEDFEDAPKLQREKSSMSGVNVWPSEAPYLRPAVLKY